MKDNTNLKKKFVVLNNDKKKILETILTVLNYDQTYLNQKTVLTKYWLTKFKDPV